MKLKGSLEDQLAAQIRLCGLPKPEREFRFEPKRRWRADFAWPTQRLLVEVQGGVFMRGRTGHSSVSGILRDQDKLNAAQLAGWCYLQVNAQTIKSGEAIGMIERALKP